MALSRTKKHTGNTWEVEDHAVHKYLIQHNTLTAPTEVNVHSEFSEANGFTVNQVNNIFFIGRVMAKISIHDVGSVGIIRDVPDHLLPPEAWSNGQKRQVFRIVRWLNLREIGRCFDPPTVRANLGIIRPGCHDGFVVIC